MVNCIAPGPTGTDLFLKGKSERLINTIAGFSPLKRIGKPEEVADLAEALCGNAGAWVTGQVVKCNGGMA
jgi:3-oxoacyl-[acyl-carrier protein] reductase